MQAEACTPVDSTMGGLPGFPGSTEPAGGVDGVQDTSPNVNSAPVLVLGAADWTALGAVKDGHTTDASQCDRLIGVHLLEKNAKHEISLTAIGLEALIMKRAGFYKLLAKLLNSVGAADSPVPHVSIWQRLRSRRAVAQASRPKLGLLKTKLLRRRSCRPSTGDSADVG